MANSKLKGRPKLDISKRYRARTWYYAVKARNPALSDYALGLKIAEQVNGIEGTSIRAFDTIRRNGALPSRKDKHHLRKYDLVDVVEAMPGYEGTSRIINSPFWEMVDKPDISLERLREIVIKCIELLNLSSAASRGVIAQYEKSNYSELLDKLADDNPDMPISEYLEQEGLLLDWYDNELSHEFGKAIATSDATLDYIALLCALGLEANKANNLKIASYNIDCAEKLLDLLSLQPWIKPMATKLKRLLRARMLTALNKDLLAGLPSYHTLLLAVPGANPNSPIAIFLNKYQRQLWRK